MIYELGEKLKHLREAYHLYAKDVAKSLNVSPTMVYQYEIGTAQPDIEGLIKLAEIYHTTLDFLLGLDDEFPLVVDGLSKHEINSILLLNQNIKDALSK